MLFMTTISTQNFLQIPKPRYGSAGKSHSLGMKEICITDHHDHGSQFCPDDFTLDLPTYIESLRKIKDEYADRIRLNIGIELGLQNHVGDYLHDFCKNLGERI